MNIAGGSLSTQAIIPISGANAYRIFDVQGVDVSVSNLRLINGQAVGGAELGYGGAIKMSSNGGNLTLTSVTLSGNHAQSRGGAIYLPSGGGTLSITNCTFDSNTVDSYGGAIDQTGGILILSSSTLSNNTASDGGALELESASDCRVKNVTFSGNRASNNGGAISRIGTTYNLDLNNVTISNNTADSDNNGSGDGGGIYRGGGAIIVGNSIIAGNFDTANNAGPGTINSDCAWLSGGGFTSRGYNVIGRVEGAPGFTSAGDKAGTNASPLDPKLAPLAFNGGPTQTHLLLADSPALDGGNPAGAGNFGACETADQRGVGRAIDGNGDGSAICDSGSVEAPLTMPTPTPTPTATPQATARPSPTATPESTPTPSASASPTAVAQLQNLSTRKQVGTGDNRLIGGFIVVGTDDKKVLLRGLGPSLPVNGALVDPVLELHRGDSTLLAANDNWRDATNASEIAAILPPSQDAESAILTSIAAKPLSEGGAGYTGILAGKDGTTGVGLLEVYDLNAAANSTLANISTRGFVGTGDDLLIGGFIPGPSDRAPVKVLVRALGPSLGGQGVSGALQDPVLELHDANGIFLQNDNWHYASNASEIQSTLPPPDVRESAIIMILAPSSSGYTALVRGANGSTGVALVEVYALQ